MLRMTILEILGEAGFRKALQIYIEDEAHFVPRVRDELIRPRMDFIDRMFSGVNDPEFLAKMVLFQMKRMIVNPS